ncbi:endonuclease III domain-containing protein [Desulfonema ishimotonii]|uniref:Endonuclease III domain-containing protein n=1 Tax=Desulfonema ishimotonii TaxID=45657 RepID=A0A401FV54_9BACT|nr:endonuclease [Desulfonema ishimotonii]GBC60835.1 endonuclease III domain-containing protein [Desulfonema ishimotonii]
MTTDNIRQKVVRLDRLLLDRYGRQGWWPTTRRKGEPPVYRPGEEGRTVSDPEAFEIMVGAILTQNTAWTNVEKAMVSLTGADLLDIGVIARCDGRLEEAIRPSGYFNQKAARLRGIAKQIHHAGGIRALRDCPTALLRDRLLSWKGVGPETADSVLCYAFARPVFVADRYTGRLFERLGLPSGSYDVIQSLVHQAIAPSAAAYGDFHARIVTLFKNRDLEPVAEALV